MPQISGVTISSTTSIAGINVTSISAIAGILTANISGWPSAGPSCTTLILGYADGRRNPPSAACTAPPQPYDYDSSSGILYTDGFCGNPAGIVAAGYYSDGAMIYDFTNGVLVEWGPCGR